MPRVRGTVNSHCTQPSFLARSMVQWASSRMGHSPMGFPPRCPRPRPPFRQSCAGGHGAPYPRSIESGAKPRACAAQCGACHIQERRGTRWDATPHRDSWASCGPGRAYHGRQGQGLRKRRAVWPQTGQTAPGGTGHRPSVGLCPTPPGGRWRVRRSRSPRATEGGRTA